MSNEKKIKVHKSSAGVYYYWLDGKPEHRVCVNQIPGNPAYGDPTWMWVAVAEWRNDAYGDPVETKREAMESARIFLTDKFWA